MSLTFEVLISAKFASFGSKKDWKHDQLNILRFSVNCSTEVGSHRLQCYAKYGVHMIPIALVLYKLWCSHRI